MPKTNEDVIRAHVRRMLQRLKEKARSSTM
jgi:Arc/MetJ-type ribon-helix-helix transcriptional regulator